MISTATDRRLVLLLVTVAAVMGSPTVGTAVTDGPTNNDVRISSDLVVDEVTFGYVEESTGRIVETRRIDTAKHPGFGWRLEFEGRRQTIRFREEFMLPSPAQTWQVGHETTVAADRASAVTEGDRRLGSEMTLRNAWIHTEGDPKGQHTMRIWVDGKLVREIDFVLY